MVRLEEITVGATVAGIAGNDEPVRFVEIKEDGSAVDAGHAPYLDYRPATETEKAALGAFIENRGRLNANVEAKAVNHAVSQIIPAHFAEVKKRKTTLIEKTATVTKNEILTALNKPDEYILAIVEVDGNSLQTAYLKKPFRERPDFATTSVNYGIAELMGGAEIILRRGDV